MLVTLTPDSVLPYNIYTPFAENRIFIEMKCSGRVTANVIWTRPERLHFINLTNVV